MEAAALHAKGAAPPRDRCFARLQPLIMSGRAAPMLRAALVVFGFALTELHPPEAKRDAADYDAIAPDDAEAARVQ